MSDDVDRIRVIQEYTGKPEGILSLGAVARSPLVFDCETNALHPDDGARVSVISVAWLMPGGVAQYAAYPFGQGGHPKSSEPVADEGPDVWEALMAAIERWPRGLAGHNVKFDGMMVEAGSLGQDPGARSRLTRPRLVFDTMIMAKEAWPTHTAALKPTAARLWGEDETEEQQALKPWLGPKTKPNYHLVPWSVMKPYAAKDAVLTLRLLMHVWEMIQQGEVSGSWVARETYLMRTLLDLEQAGMPFDAERSKEIAIELEGRRDALLDRLPFEKKDAKKFFFGRDLPGALGLEPYSRTAITKQPQLTAEVLDRMVIDEVPWAKELGQINKIETALKMWYRPYAERTAPDGRIRTVFRQVASGRGVDGGTASGRYSVERLNLQAIPHDYRLGPALAGVESPRGLVARGASRFEGWTMYELDLAQAELRVAALWSGCSLMLRHIDEGADVHGETAKSLFGVDPGSEQWGFLRQVAKRANFSLIFGSGAKTFRAMIAKETGTLMPMGKAKQLVYDWNDLYPEYGRAIETYMRQAETLGYTELVNGRRRWYAPGEDRHKAFNQRVQGSLAEYGKDWIISTKRLMDENEIDGRFRREFPGCGGAGLIMVIHDSQVLLLPDSAADGLTERVIANSETIWSEMFAGVPGGAEVHAWDS